MSDEEFWNATELGHLEERCNELRTLMMSQRPLRFTIWGDNGAVEGNFLPHEVVRDCIRVELQKVTAKIVRLRKEIECSK